MNAKALDHVALWTDLRDEIAAFACAYLGMHEIERTDAFTLIGVDARRGKITLFDADGPRERGALGRISLRVADLDEALARLPDRVAAELCSGRSARFEIARGVEIEVVEETGVPYDLREVVLRVPDPDLAAIEFTELGFDHRGERLVIQDKALRLEHGEGDGERPLLNHIALLVESAEAVESEARRRGLEVADVKDAENTLAVFLWGPERIKLEYVEHKPSFALA